MAEALTSRTNPPSSRLGTGQGRVLGHLHRLSLTTLGKQASRPRETLCCSTILCQETFSYGYRQLHWKTNVAGSKLCLQKTAQFIRTINIRCLEARTLERRRKKKNLLQKGFLFLVLTFMLCDFLILLFSFNIHSIAAVKKKIFLKLLVGCCFHSTL